MHGIVEEEVLHRLLFFQYTRCTGTWCNFTLLAAPSLIAHDAVPRAIGGQRLARLERVFHFHGSTVVAHASDLEAWPDVGHPRLADLVQFSTFFTVLAYAVTAAFSGSWRRLYIFLARLTGVVADLREQHLDGFAGGGRPFAAV